MVTPYPCIILLCRHGNPYLCTTLLCWDAGLGDRFQTTTGDRILQTGRAITKSGMQRFRPALAPSKLSYKRSTVASYCLPFPVALVGRWVGTRKHFNIPSLSGFWDARRIAVISNPMTGTAIAPSDLSSKPFFVLGINLQKNWRPVSFFR